jgi:hypothetical protein
MSAGRFWGRSRDAAESVPAAPTPAWTLTALDRCDRCGAQAYVRVLLPSRLELLFCAHHNRKHARALAEIAVEIRDETRRLARSAA